MAYGCPHQLLFSIIIEDGAVAINMCFAWGFLPFQMVPGMVQDGSDMVQKQPDVTKAYYLQAFRDGS